MAQNSSENFKTYNTRILLVDHDKHSIASTTRMLVHFAYIVIIAETGSRAMDLISNEEIKFDLMLMETQLPDLDSFSLLDRAVDRGIPTILMLSDHGNAMVVKMGLQRGACFYFEKPLTNKTVEGLWLHLVKNKITKVKSTSENVEANSNVPKKSRNSGMPWTDELHQKFVKAMHQLGNENCYPKEILELMNVPGLTRMQVSSHLQKCRNGNWSKLPNKGMVNPKPSKHNGRRPRKYGLMPPLLMPSNVPHPTPMQGNQAVSNTNENVQSALNFPNQTQGDWSIIGSKKDVELNEWQSFPKRDHDMGLSTSDSYNI